MQKLAKRLSVFMAAIMTLSMMLNFALSAPVKAAAVYPQVQYAQEPQLEYTVGDRVQFNLYTPNYGGRVQYRVVLWQDETKSYKDLWTNTPDRYYDKWMPYGNNIFTLGWIINEPGHYRITIYAKRAGVANNDTYLKGFNCDSYMESDSFVVKAKEVAKEEPKPDIASEKIELASVTTSPAAINGYASKSAQAIIGKDYELAVKVDKPGVKVMFSLDAPDGSLNKDEVLEAVSDSDNVAKVSYKRLYADADFVTAYVAAAPTVRTSMKVYWGVDKILDIAATTEDAANAANGNVKSYKVTLKNPITGERMRNRELLVLLRENIEAPNNAALSTALITNPYGTKATTYQRMNNIVTGGLNQETVALKTNDNGEAAFTVTGTNTKATPVVFYDDLTFYKGPDDNGWNTPDTSQFKPTFAGNNNKRWDETELQVEPATVTFNASTFTFEQTAIADPYAATDTRITETKTKDEKPYDVFVNRTGKTYTLTIKDADGKPYSKGIVNIAINEYIDGLYNTNTNARIISVGTTSSNMTLVDKAPNPNNPTDLYDTLGFYKVQATTSSTGVVMFKIASDKINDMATPIVWIDQDNANPYNGLRNGILDPADPQKLLSQTIFVESAVKSAVFSAAIANEDLVMKTDENDDVVSINDEPVKFTYKVRNQNGSAWMPAGAYANITYTIQNIGNSPVTVSAPVAGIDANGKEIPATEVSVDNRIGSFDKLVIPTYQTRTISFRTYSSVDNYISIVSGGNAKVNVTANANLVVQTNTAGAWLAPATAVASWVKAIDVSDYTTKTLFSSTVFGYNLAANYAIVVPATDTSSYVKIPYNRNDVYTVTTQQHPTALDSDIVEFETQISEDDGITYRFGNGGINYISLYNADNSYDNKSDEKAPIALDITSELTQDGKDEVVTYNQTTFIDVVSGTETSGVGNFRFGDKWFTPIAGMTTYQVANLIAEAGTITIDNIPFKVELNGVLGGLKFTATLQNMNRIKVEEDFQPERTGVGIARRIVGDGIEVVKTTVPAVQEQVTLTVNSGAAATRTLLISVIETVKDGDNYKDVVIKEVMVDVLAGDTVTIVASKIREALDYYMTGYVPYTIGGTDNFITITRNQAGPAMLKVTIK